MRLSLSLLRVCEVLFKRAFVLSVMQRNVCNNEEYKALNRTKYMNDEHLQRVMYNVGDTDDCNQNC